MSAGPDHYREAERLLVLADGLPPEAAGDFLAAAQVHATLALAAAVAGGGQAWSAPRGEWFRLLGEPSSDGAPS